MKGKQISINFCGGCNPRIDRGLLAEKLQNILQRDGYHVYYNSRIVDFIIYISGCTASCARRYSNSTIASVVVAAATLDAAAVAENELVVKIVEKVRAYFG